MKRILLLLTLSFCLLQGGAQDVPFNGYIKDLTGNPCKNATVWIHKGLEASTNKQGRFGLTNVAPTDTLHVKYRKLIYLVPVNGRKSISITLGNEISNFTYNNEDEPELADFGFGYVKRRESLTVSNGISGEALRRTGQSTILGALRGQIPGLKINSANDMPGGTSVASLRGVSSINSGTAPLFIVDGSPVDDLDSVNIYDVESVEVIKDGTLYGVRGANGVIVVRTIGAGK